MHDLTAGEPDLPSGRYLHRYIYKANSPDYPVDIGVGEHGWKPSIHMPREAARLFLTVKDIQVERLQDITEEDVIAEGIKNVFKHHAHHDGCTGIAITANHKGQFRDLWDSINKKRGYGWDVNPWVWVVKFDRVNVA